MTNAGGEIVYIGQAKSLRQRVLQHFERGRHREETTYGRASLLRFLNINDAEQLNALERGWLNQCVLADGNLPPLNLVEGPI
jgi:excinuclease UvrABC nuclease subunit